MGELYYKEEEEGRWVVIVERQVWVGEKEEEMKEKMQEKEMERRDSLTRMQLNHGMDLNALIRKICAVLVTRPRIKKEEEEEVVVRD